MGLKIDYIQDQTELDEDEKEGLLIQSITTREELNEFEQQNIEKAIRKERIRFANALKLF